MNLLNDCMFSYAIHAGILTLCEYLGRKITNQTETWNDQEIIRFLYFQANKTDELRSNPFQTGGQYSNPMFNPQKAGPKNNNVSMIPQFWSSLVRWKKIFKFYRRNILKLTSIHFTNTQSLIVYVTFSEIYLIPLESTLLMKRRNY